jgi:hypothetical protein
MVDGAQTTGSLPLEDPTLHPPAERDKVKLSSDFQYLFGSEEGSTVPTSPVNSIQPNFDESQFAWRIQLSAAF